MPKASIVVPSHNVAETLPETLSALLRQSWRDFEVLVVDDGSSDATPEIAEVFARRDGRVRHLRQDNRGLAGARNTGLAAASGAYVGFCDADDVWEQRKLEAHVRHLDECSNVGISFSGSRLVDNAGRPTRLAQRPRLRDIRAEHVFKRNPIGNGSAPVMRREAFDEIAWRPSQERVRDWWFDETFRQSEDIEAWLRFALLTEWDIEGVPGLLVRYRVNAAGLSAGTDAQYRAWQRMVEKLSPLAPEFFQRHAPAARAYQLRYLCRRAVSSGEGGRAVRLGISALRASPRPLVEEPLKTGITLAAALAGPIATRFAMRANAAQSIHVPNGA